MPPPEPAVLANRFLDVIEQNIVPKTREGVAAGNKLFGAAILRKSDLSLVIAGTNAETENPLFHGEISTLNTFYRLPADRRPTTRDCLFLSTHEPCSLCLSAITWTGFDNFFYLFGYEDTRDAFNIPHDLKILQEVFRVEHGDYARENEFWTSRAIADLVAEASGVERQRLMERIDALSKTYAELSETYQRQKGSADIPLA
jgi:tRNA(Arg) A34 adenosine deaminase TadA